MQILYVIHAFPWNETTGVTSVLDNYVKESLKNNIKVSILVPDNAYTQIEHTLYGKDVRLYAFKSQENWSVSAFDFQILNDEVPYPFIDFVPDLIHIIDWVGFHPAIYKFLKGFNSPVVRTVCNFEEFCPMMSPIYFRPNAEVCQLPLDPNQCLDCVSDNHKLTIPNSLYTYKVLISDLLAYRNNYRNGMIPLIKRRTEFVRYLFKKYVDFVLFPSKNFGNYFLSQFNDSINYRVIPHGIRDINDRAFRSSTLPVKIIYTGGNLFSKGWDIMFEAVQLLTRTPNHSIEIHFVGNAHDIPEHFFHNSNIKLKRSAGYRIFDDPNYLNFFDIAVAPSHFESYGLFVRECLRSRVIPLVIPTFGLTDFVVNGVNGFNIEHPIVENLTNTILELTSDVMKLNELRFNLNVSTVPTAEVEFKELHILYRELSVNDS